MGSLNSLPSVEQILQTGEAAALTASYGRPLTLRAVRQTLEGLRQELKMDGGQAGTSVSSILESSGHLLSGWTRTGPHRVINATGVILHTNLGRAPLSQAARAAMVEIATGYANVELDLKTGKRGGRLQDIGDALKMLTGAEATLVVNNNAAAVLLILSALASRKRVAIARSQLVEIGGGFRMPDVMRQSGARLVEVGTTNKVRLSDYEEAFAQTQMVVRVHRSNFKMVGFTSEPDLASIARTGHTRDQIVVDDLGSGALLDTTRFGLAHEPMVQESLAAGVDIVCFSGDKLLGGPQAGIILGKAELVGKLAKHPLARAVRADKITLAGLSATLTHYLLNEAEKEVPVWQMIGAPLEQIASRAKEWADDLGEGEAIAGESTLGGGSLPGETLPTHVLGLSVRSPDATAGCLAHPRSASCGARRTPESPAGSEDRAAPGRRSADQSCAGCVDGAAVRADLDSLMAARGMDAIVVLGHASHNPAMHYLVGGGHITNGVVVKKQGAPAVVYCNAMERAEAGKSGLEVIPLKMNGVDVLLKDPKQILEPLGLSRGRVGLYGSLDAGDLMSIIARVREALPELELVGEPKEDSLFLRAMETKDEAEVDHIRRMGQITTEVVGKVASLLQNSPVRRG